MKKIFPGIDDLLSWVGDDEEKNGRPRSFIEEHPKLCIESLKAFKKKYYPEDKNNPKGKGKPLGAKFSERVFSYWLYKEVEEFDPTIESQKELVIKLPFIKPLTQLGNPENEVKIKKTPDLYLQYNNRKILVEFKTNIDMVEKDLYKFWLYKRHGNPDKEILFFIWEGEDNRFYKRGNRSESQYHSMLRLAVRDTIDEFVYFPIAENFDKEVLNHALEKLRSFLGVCPGFSNVK